MTETPDPQEHTPAALVGSLAVFDLPLVLRLLADTEQGGELQVVGGGVDGRLWFDRGELTGWAVPEARTLTEAVFDLALLDEGWFYFTQGAEVAEPTERAGVVDVLETVRPQVAEWRELLTRVPLTTVIRLSPTPPAAEVNIRTEQWQVLTTLGNQGMAVSDLLAALPHEQVVSLRLLSELVEAGLAVVEGDLEPPVDGPGRDGGAEADEVEPVDAVPGWRAQGEPPPYTGPGADEEEEQAGRAEVVPDSDVTVLPPPISADPWAPPPPVPPVPPRSPAHARR